VLGVDQGIIFLDSSPLLKSWRLAVFFGPQERLLPGGSYGFSTLQPIVVLFDWSDGVLECWSDDKKTSTPSLLGANLSVPL
jgi:hypothetical protein